MPNFVPYFHFQISGPSFTDENCHNLRNSHDIDNELGAITKLDKSNKATSKKWLWHHVSKCDVIVLYPIYEQFAATRRPDSKLMVCKTFIFINSNLLSNKTWKQRKNLNTALILLPWVEVLSFPKNTIFLQQQQQIWLQQNEGGLSTKRYIF